MQKILKSVGLLAGALAVVGAGATGAFFSDTETSSGNVFTAGAIDLLIDNDSYYNGEASPETSWELTDLTEIHKFFNFLDLKPGDWGEDTISIHVDTNDAYLCADVTLTSNDDNTQTEPEALDDPNGLEDGELAGLVNFIWWADDGDNVLEDNETPISPVGPIGAIGVGNTISLALADTDENIWGGVGPIDGDTTYYIGKAWCFGTMTLAPVAAGQEQDPTIDGGFTCDGSLLGNESQTDSLTADVSFEAVQARNNPNFQCDENEECEMVVDTGTNLVTNGGFEEPLVATPQNWDVFDSVAGGWTIEWRSDIPAIFGPQNRPDPAHLELHRNVLGVADEGQQYAELDSDWGGPASAATGEPASIVIYQDIATTPGDSYEISFAFAPRPNTAAAQNNLEVLWGGSNVTTLGPTAGPAGNLVPGSWTTHAFTVVATTSTTRIQFADSGTANSEGTFLDDVQVHPMICEIPNV